MRNVDHQQVLALRARSAQIVDTLGDREFRSAHIYGAKHLPLKRVLHDARYQIQPERPIVTYCRDNL